MMEMDVEKYREVFRKSAVKRAKFEGLKRNLEAWKEWKEIDNQMESEQ